MVKRAVVLLLAVAGCEPTLEDPLAIVTAPRLIAVQSVPAEAPPGQPVAVTALWVAPDGPPPTAPLSWAFCTARKPFTEPGPVDPACLTGASPDLTSFGAGVVASGTLPAAGCRLFGPDRPDALPGQPAGRPVDPDGTGGYYQPIVVGGAGASALEQVRITCGLPTATPDQAAEFTARHHPNSNPTIASVAIADDAGAETPLTPLESDPSARASVAAGARVHLIVRWPPCGTDEAPCDGAESYVWFDPDARDLVTRREAMRASWFATAGAYDDDHSGRAEADADEPWTDDVWTAPAAAGDALVWVVLRDDRGGAAWASFRLAVQ